MICGDLLDDTIIEKVKMRKPDIVVVPLARSTGTVPYAQHIWDKEEKAAYVEQVKELHTMTLLVNYIDAPGREGSFFGGAFVINPQGEIEAQKNVMEEEIHYWDR